MLFPLGSLLATPGVLRQLSRYGYSPIELVTRHSRGDFGDLGAHDIGLNHEAIAQGARVLSAYAVGSERVYVITEADRSCTTVLLASEY
jgi:hypothetical protein